MSRLLLVEPDYYEDQKRLHENIARLERERLLIEQSITAERAAVNATAAQDANAWKARLENNIKTAKLKIEENREIMRSADRLLFKIDAALEDCEYLESLKENMLNYAKEAYERWRSEDPDRAAKYWAERHIRQNGVVAENVDVNEIEKIQESPMTIEEESYQCQEMQVTSPRSFSKSPVQISNSTEKSIPSILKKKTSVEDNSENSALGQSYAKKSPRFSEHVEVSEFEKVTSREVGLEEIASNSFSTERSENAPTVAFANAPSEQPLVQKSSPKKEKTSKKDPVNMTPLEFFSASSSYSRSRVNYADPVMSSEDSIVTSEESFSKNFNTNDSSFMERRLNDEKNEFIGLDERNDVKLNIDLGTKTHCKPLQLSMLGLQALFNRIESEISVDSIASGEFDSLYSATFMLTNINEVIEFANRNELNKIAADVCAQTVLVASPSLLSNQRLLNAEKLNFEKIQSLEDFSTLVEETNKDVYDSLSQHLLTLLTKLPRLAENLSRNLAKVFVGNDSSCLNAMQETLFIVMNKHISLDASQDDASITHISMATPRSNRMSSPIGQTAECSGKRQPPTANDTQSSKEFDILEQRSSLQGDEKDKEHRNIKDADADDDEDSFPFTSQSLDDHLNFSFQSDSALKTSNAYQSLLQSAFGPQTKPDSETGSPTKGLSGQFKVSDFVTYESEDEIECQLMQSATGPSKSKRSPDKRSNQKFYSLRSKEDQTLSPKRSNSVANNESRDLFSSGEEETSLPLSSARSKKDAIDITADVRSSLARKSGGVSNSSTFAGGSAVALRDFGDIDLGVSDDEGQNSPTDILGITPRDKHLADESSDDSDFFS